ncbi:hypothetical protein CMV_010112 [Castanea mollissima]|uniref:Uncharacterized protein n=1 Tax=Castanea mollissima TaxID=60419 RepID=A0A8J4R5Z2_9ROSI|nr:hypothetical protein CMV_010112 [Castanea mollissima]
MKKLSFVHQLTNILLAPASTKFLHISKTSLCVKSPKFSALLSPNFLKFMKHALDLRKKVGDLRGLRWKPLQFIPEIHLQPS